MFLENYFLDSIKDEIELVVIPELLEITEQTGYLPMADDYSQ
jgi:hypothetical protein